MGAKQSDNYIIGYCEAKGLTNVTLVRVKAIPRVSYNCLCGNLVENKNFYKIKNEDQYLCKQCSQEIRIQAQIKYSKSKIKEQLSNKCRDKPIKLNEGIKSYSSLICEKCQDIYTVRNEEVFTDYFQGHPNCPFRIKIKSKGEYFIKELLDLHKIDYLYNKTLRAIRIESRMMFDFYLPDYNLIIEFDGIQHFSKRELRAVGYKGSLNNCFRMFDKFKHQRQRDKLKNNLYLTNGFNVLRIPAWQITSIKDIIVPILKRLDVCDGLVYTDMSFYSKKSRRLI